MLAKTFLLVAVTALAGAALLAPTAAAGPTDNCIVRVLSVGLVCTGETWDCGANEGIPVGVTNNGPWINEDPCTHSWPVPYLNTIKDKVKVTIITDLLP